MSEFTSAKLKKALEKSLETKDMVAIDGKLGWYASMTVGNDVGSLSVRYVGVVWHDGHGLACKMENVSTSPERAAIGLARDLCHWQRYLLWPEKPSESIKAWYQRLCPDDQEGEYLDDVPFYVYLTEAAKARDFYVCGVDDSVVRLRVMAALNHVMNCNDDYINDLW